MHGLQGWTHDVDPRREKFSERTSDHRLILGRFRHGDRYKAVPFPNLRRVMSNRAARSDTSSKTMVLCGGNCGSWI